MGTVVRNLVGVLVLVNLSCGTAPAEVPARTLTLGTGGQGGAFYALGPVLGQFWRDHIAGIEVRHAPGGSGVNVESLEMGQTDIAFTQADIAYAAYSRGTERDRRPHLQLRAIAVLWMNTVHVAVPNQSAIRTVADLRGRRVGATTRGGGTETLARVVLGAYDLTYDDITPQFDPFVQTTERLQRGDSDAAFVVAGVPAVAVTDLAAHLDIRLLAIPRERLRTMRAEYPFLRPVVVPRGTYKGVDEAVETVGVNNLLMCRKDLDERLVYQLTKGLFDAIPALEAAHPAASLIDPDEAPATPIPLHPGAARFYREREITK